MSAITSDPTLAPVARPAPLRYYASCLGCGHFDSLDVRWELCARCLSAALEGLVTLRRSRRCRHAATLSAWLQVALLGALWLGGAALFGAALFAFVPNMRSL